MGGRCEQFGRVTSVDVRAREAQGDEERRRRAEEEPFSRPEVEEGQSAAGAPSVREADGAISLCVRLAEAAPQLTGATAFVIHATGTAACIQADPAWDSSDEE